MTKVRTTCIEQLPTNFNVRADSDRWVEIKDPDGYPSLDFKPMVLRSPFLIYVLIFFLGCFTSMFTVLYLSKKDGSIHFSSKPSYAVHYLPAVVGTTTKLLWLAITSDLKRLTPYMSMAEPGRNQWRNTMGAAYFPLFCIDFRTGLGCSLWHLHYKHYVLCHFSKILPVLWRTQF